MVILMWMVAAYGMSTILVYGSIFNGLRNWIHKNSEPNVGLKIFNSIFGFLSELIKCMLCTSTWVGFFFSTTLYSPWHELIGFNKYISIFFDGMLSAGSVWAINAIIEWFEENRPVKNQSFIDEMENEETQILND